MPQIEFTVPGIPAAKGSLRGIPYRKKDGSYGVVQVQESNTLNYVAAVRAAAAEAMQQAGACMTDNRVRLMVFFYLPRPKKHFRGEKLREDAPYHCAKRPDIDKLLRSVCDALTGVVWRDDAQVAVCRAEKIYDSQPCTHIQVLFH